MQQEILRVIRIAVSHSAIPLRFMVASRPEAHIREAFDSGSYLDVRRFNVEQSFHDVRKYLCDEFARIHREHHTMANIPLPWPLPDVLEKLVWKSSGHFIYASTIIKFIDDKNYRATQRLAVVRDTNGTGSKSAFDPLDQLYMTILSSAPRQSEFIPILCAIVHFRLTAGDIDKLLGLAEGDTRLQLRGLHSVLDVRSDKTVISSHHASFLDFLSNPDRSGNFCVGTLNRRIGLAQSLLQFCTGPFQRENNICPASRLIHFIKSLPPSGAVAELCPLVGSMNPDYIFGQGEGSDGVLVFFVSWLKNTPSAPADIMQLWEDYAFMFSIDTMRCQTYSPSFERIITPSPELLRVVVSMGLLRHPLWELPIKLDLTWTDLRTSLCSLQPKWVGDEYVPHIHQPQAASPWVARDLAFYLIWRMVKNHILTDGGVNPSACRDAVLLYNGTCLGTAYLRAQYDLGCDISYLVRLSPPCPVLYRGLWSIPPSEIWSSW
ncbi:hypothetical protein C8R45DRAFT_906358, partial [Mycena sanguinolenta]